jgi:hypothetical protein
VQPLSALGARSTGPSMTRPRRTRLILLVSSHLALLFAGTAVARLDRNPTDAREFFVASYTERSANAVLATGASKAARRALEFHFSALNTTPGEHRTGRLVTLVRLAKVAAANGECSLSKQHRDRAALLCASEFDLAGGCDIEAVARRIPLPRTHEQRGDPFQCADHAQ